MVEEVKKKKKLTKRKKVVKIKENDLTTSKEFLSTLDKFIKAEPVKKDTVKPK